MIKYKRLHGVLSSLTLLVMLILQISLVEAKEALPTAADPVLEKRVMVMARDLRCLVCQGQSVGDSDSGFSNDVKHVIRTQMRDGKSDDEIIDFLVERYGDFIRFNPPFNAQTAVVWFGPVILLLIGAIILVVSLRRRRGQVLEDKPLSDDEGNNVAKLLNDKDGK